MKLTEREIVERLATAEKASWLSDDFRELIDAARALVTPEPDYASWIGALVEVSDDGNVWTECVLTAFNSKDAQPFYAGGCSWFFCRVYPKPLKLIFTLHDGVECSFGEDEWAIVKYRNGIQCMPVRSLNQGIRDGRYKASDISGYMRVEL